MAIGQEVGRRLSVKELGWDKASILKVCLADEALQHFLARFVGQATGVRPYKIKEGDRAGEIAYGLLGMFEGTNADGEVKSGSVCYLPGYVNDMIVAVLQSSEDISGVRIAFDIYAKYDADAATSYVFIANDLLNTGSASVDEVKESIKALPMPNKTLALEGGKTAPKAK